MASTELEIYIVQKKWGYKWITDTLVVHNIILSSLKVSKASLNENNWHTWYLKSEERTIGKIPNLIMNKLFMNKKKSTSEKSYLLNTKDIINVKEKDWTQEKNQKKMLNYY